MSMRSDSSEQGPLVSVELVAGIVMLAFVSVFIFNSGDVLLDWVFPLVLATAGAVIGVYFVIRGLLGRGAKMPLLPPLLRGKGVLVAVFVVIAVFYTGLARVVGFWIMSWLMVFTASLYLAEERNLKQAAVSAVIALAISLVGFWLFSRVFFVPFPRATWLPWG